MHYAAENGHVEVVHALREAGVWSDRWVFC